MTSAIDLKPSHLDIVERILAEHVPGLEVRAFGSRASWTARDYSDIDLAVVGDGPLQWRTLSRLREAFEESRLPMRVDVLDWHAISEGFRETIKSDCVVVQEPAASADWREVAIGEIADIVGGGTPSTRIPENFGGDIPWLTPKDLSGIHDRYVERGERNLSQHGLDSSSARLLPAGSVLLSTRAPIGYVAIAKNPIATNQGFRSLVVRDEAVPEYLYYWLKLNTEELERHASGSTFRELSGSSLKEIRLRLPPLEEQRAIARVLGALDDKIELNRRMSETLEEMARALFRSWFVDFDPVRAKAEGRPSGLPPDLDALFPDSFVASELGKIPKGWEVRSLDEIATFTNGLALQRFPPERDEWLPVIKIAEMKRGYSDRTGRASASIDQRYIVEDGDLLFSWSGSLELALWTHGRGALNQHLFKVTSDEFPRWFYLGWTREHLDEFRTIAAGKATTMGHIQRHHLTDARVAAPPANTAVAADKYIAGLMEQEVRHAVESRSITEQRDTLLPRLVSGEVRLGVLAPEEP